MIWYYNFFKSIILLKLSIYQNCPLTQSAWVTRWMVGCWTDLREWKKETDCTSFGFFRHGLESDEKWLRTQQSQRILLPGCRVTKQSHTKATTDCASNVYRLLELYNL